MTEDLIRIIFSKSAQTRAKSKLDLGSKVDTLIQRDIENKPEEVLELVFMEANLTPTEILSMLTSSVSKTDSLMCIHCMMPVEIGDVIYHSYCPVME